MNILPVRTVHARPKCLPPDGFSANTSPFHFKVIHSMQTYISILRGINVSGQRKILMADLKALYESLGLSDVRTYIQSGNVVFATDMTASNTDLARTLEQAIAKQYLFNVPVIVRNTAEMRQILETNPFARREGIQTEKLHVTFLAEAPPVKELEKVRALNYSPDEFVISGTEVFLHCPGGYGETKLSNKFFENKLKVSATTRNWNTVNKLVELATTL
jgi:uncharacterized protein (DUF1697 family)